MNISSKIYYNINTGNIVKINPEYTGEYVVLSKEDDLRYIDDIVLSEIDYIELEYGTLHKTFSNSKSYYVDINTKKLVVEYYTKEELDKMQQEEIENQEPTELEKLQLENEKLIDEIINLKAENLLLKMED